MSDLAELPPEQQSTVTLRSLVKPVPFVPETKRTADLLKELQQSTTQLAIVIDEYGAVAGLVTIEDLVEEIVGEIRDEVEPHARDIIKESESSYLVAGQTELAQVADQLQVDIEDRDYSTVAGLVLAQLGHVPIPGEKVEKNGLSFEVLEANSRTVLKVRLSVARREADRFRLSERPTPVFRVAYEGKARGSPNLEFCSRDSAPQLSSPAARLPAPNVTRQMSRAVPRAVHEQRRA